MEELDHSVKENIKSKKPPEWNVQKLWDSIKAKTNEYRYARRDPDQRHIKYFQQHYRKKKLLYS